MIRFVASLEWTGVPIVAVAGFCSTWYELGNIWNYSLRHVVIAAGLFVSRVGSFSLWHHTVKRFVDHFGSHPSWSAVAIEIL